MAFRSLIDRSRRHCQCGSRYRDDQSVFQSPPKHGRTATANTPRSHGTDSWRHHDLYGVLRKFPDGSDTGNDLSISHLSRHEPDLHHRGHQSVAETDSRVKNRLKILRAERSWTQANLAECLGVTRQTINAIEKGKYDPSLPLAFKIAALFEVPIEAIFSPDGE